MKKVIISIFSIFLLTSCFDQNTTNNNSNNTVTVDTKAFPEGLSVTAPANTEDDDEASNDKATAKGLSSRISTGGALKRVNDLLSGASPLRDVFTPKLFYKTIRKANCFGPEMKYANHPDGSSASSGTLPTSDLGIWQETERGSTKACAAAQLRKLMRGVRWRSMSALMITASSLYQLHARGDSLPADGDTADVTSEMNALGIPNVSFTSVTISNNSGIYEYTVKFDHTRSSSSGSTTLSHEIKLKHQPSSSSVYSGILTWKVQDEYSGGTCSSGTHDITRMGSLAYERNVDTMTIDTRDAIYCGHSVADGFDSAGDLDPTNLYNSSSNPDGWSDNFTWYKSNFNKDDHSGTYAFIWQAGPNDSRSRVMDVYLSRNGITIDSATTADGEAWYGYGAKVSDTSATQGEIAGLVCNWAGPGSANTLQDYAQRQFLEFNSTSKVFEVPTDSSGISASDITYAPTNSCLYDGSGTFDYDRNLDDTLDGSDIVVVKTSGATSGELDLDLFDKGVYSDVTTHIANRGYSVPSAPAHP